MSFLNGTAEAAAAWASGALGSITQVKIGDIVVSACEGLQVPSELVVTSKTIGTGYAITDAAVKLPIPITLVIAFVDPQITAESLQTALLTGDPEGLTEGWRDKKAALYDMQNNYEIVTTQTHENIYENTIIKLIDPVFDAQNNWDGFFATVEMATIRQQSTEEGGLFDSAAAALGDL